MIHAGLPAVRSGLTGLDRYRSRKNPTGCNSAFEIMTANLSIHRRIVDLDENYHEGSVNAMEYLDGLLFTVAKRKTLYIIACFSLISKFDHC